MLQLLIAHWAGTSPCCWTVLQFPSAFLWISKCYNFFQHYFRLQFLLKINIWSFMLLPFIKSLLDLAEMMFLICRNDSGYRCGQVFHTILCYRFSSPPCLGKPISSADLHRWKAIRLLTPGWRDGGAGKEQHKLVLQSRTGSQGGNSWVKPGFSAVTKLFPPRWDASLW